MGLGRLKIEYKEGGNVVQVFNAPEVCSLVINGQVVDRYVSYVAGQFTLRGNIDNYGINIPVEAKMGYVFMKLFYNGKLVGKKFMGFG